MVTARRRPARRAGERGAAVFIVVLAIAMLTAIGVFAASSATVATTASGHAKQTTQTRYLTEYAISLVLAELERAGSLNEVDGARTQAAAAGQPLQCTALPPGSFCFSFIPRTLQDKAAQQLIDPRTSTAPGSLGGADLGWNFKVELTDKSTPMTLVAGNDETSAGAVSVKFCTVTLNARGLIWPNAAGGNQDAAIAAAGSQESLSAHVTLPCSQ